MWVQDDMLHMLVGEGPPLEASGLSLAFVPTAPGSQGPPASLVQSPPCTVGLVESARSEFTDVASRCPPPLCFSHSCFFRVQLRCLLLPRSLLMPPLVRHRRAHLAVPQERCLSPCLCPGVKPQQVSLALRLCCQV